MERFTVIANWTVKDVVLKKNAILDNVCLMLNSDIHEFKDCFNHLVR